MSKGSQSNNYKPSNKICHADIFENQISVGLPETTLKALFYVDDEEFYNRCSLEVTTGSLESDVI